MLTTKKYIVAIDQGTSSTKTLIFDEQGKAVAKGSEPLNTSYLVNGFVEQDAEEIYANVIASVSKCVKTFIQNGGDINSIAACGISNQRETFVVWDKQGKPLYPAVVWQCKRSISVCEELKQKGLQQTINEKTGLIIDPYFSATKLIWLKNNVPVIKSAIENGEAFFGTIDTWLLYKLTQGKKYMTDHTNASRTMLFNLHTLQWDEELIALFGLQDIQFPVIQSSSHLFGETDLEGIFSKPIPITAMIGDSHAAAFGEGCFEPGTAKATLGTGCSILMNIGNKPVMSNNGSVTTICWSIDDRIDYALEGVIVSCGSTIEWLKNELNFFTDSKQTESLATAVSDNGGVYLVPAFSGLGSPHWDMDRKASITGMTFSTQKNHIVRAALEAIPYQIKDVITSMQLDAGIDLEQLMTDGGMSSNQFVIQFLSDLLNKKVVTIGMPDVSALGAAYLAGLKAGVYSSIDALKKMNTDKNEYLPAKDTSGVRKYYEGWINAIKQ